VGCLRSTTYLKKSLGTVAAINLETARFFYCKLFVTSFKAQEVEKLTKERFEAIIAEDWLKICEHVDKIVAKHLQKEHIMFDKASDKLIFYRKYW
jgi:hypothetical protein